MPFETLNPLGLRVRCKLPGRVATVRHVQRHKLQTQLFPQVSALGFRIESLGIRI